MRPRRALTCLGLTAALLSGCGGAARHAAGTLAAAPPPPPPVPTLTADVLDGGTLALADRLTVAVAHARLTDVTLTDAAGQPVAADPVTADGWTGPAELTPSTGYTLVAHGVGERGQSLSLSRSFRTAPPKTTLAADVTPYGNAVVGVAHPVSVRFSAPVTDRAAVERALTVVADHPLGAASWSWISSRQVDYRPQEFWPAHTHVTVHVALAGIKAGDGVWGVESRDVAFSTGAAQVLTISDATHHATFTRDGAVVRTMGVSLGKPGYETRSGIKAIMDRNKEVRMTSASVGHSTGPDTYDELVPYAMRLTNSGEYVHGAPWNNVIGQQDISHGCTNVSLADAIWLYNTVQIGDPVITTGTKKSTERGNTLGGDWNVPWATWAKGSALA